MAAALNVWLNGRLIGTWRWSRADVHSFSYDHRWVNTPWPRPLSLSLPIPLGDKTLRGEAVKNYFDNLLPDNDRIRQRLRARFRTESTRPQDLLAALGRDCVGAVYLLPEGEVPKGWDRIEAEPLTEEQVERHLIAASSENSFGQNEDPDDFRISIAGAQEKTALLLHERQWCQPRGATPSTHIFKLPLGLVGNMRANMAESVENEWVCLRILAALGFEVAKAGMGRFGNQKVLVLERFDRRLVEGRWIARLPQEDLCQASGTAADHKYENDGGPGIAQCLGILDASMDAAADKLTFVRAQLAFWLLAATDGHAKNFSLHLLPDSQYRLTPLYDVISMWPIIGDGAGQLRYQSARLAMALRSRNAHYRLADILPRHWKGLAQRTGVPGAFNAMVEMVHQVAPALERVESELPAHFPQALWARIRKGMFSHQAVFLRNLAK